MDFFDEEILNLWKAFETNKVRYILVGGFATNFYGYDSVTMNMEIWIEDTRENRGKIRKALFETKLGDVEPIERMQFLPGWTTINLDSRLSLDFMTSLKGLEEICFNECYKLAQVYEIQDTIIRVLHLNHLIDSKKATNRLKDQLDIIELEKIRKAAEGPDLFPS